MSIEQNLADILAARYGKDVRQAIHDGIELGYNIASDAKTAAETAQDSASASAAAAANSESAAETAANNAAISAGLAEQYKDEAFHTTPAGYEDFVSETNLSLDDLYNTGVKNLLPPPTSLSDSGNISFTINADGSITACAGTISATTLRKIPIPDSLKGKTLKLSGCPTGGSTTTFRLRALINNEAATGDDTGNGMTFTIPSNSSDNYVGIYLYTGYSGPVTFKPMLTVEDAPNSDYAHYVPYAQSNVALTATTILKSIRIYGDGSKTQATLLNELFTALNGLGKNVLVSKVIFRTNDGPSNIQMGSVYDHNLSYFNVFNVTVGANDIVHSNVYLNSSSSRAIQNTNGTSVNYSSQVLTSSQYVELDYYEM